MAKTDCLLSVQFLACYQQKLESSVSFSLSDQLCTWEFWGTQGRLLEGTTVGEGIKVEFIVAGEGIRMESVSVEKEIRME